MTSELDHQLRATTDQLAQRLSMGDRLEVPRSVEHFAYFRRKAAAHAAAAELGGLGYSVHLHRRWLRSLLHVEKVTPVDAAAAQAFVREVYSVVARHGGDYDGWGGDVAGES